MKIVLKTWEIKKDSHNFNKLKLFDNALINNGQSNAGLVPILHLQCEHLSKPLER